MDATVFEVSVYGQLALLLLNVQERKTWQASHGGVNVLTLWLRCKKEKEEGVQSPLLFNGSFSDPVSSN